MSIFNFFYQFSVDHVIKKDKKHSNVTEFCRSSELRTAAELCRFLGGFDLVISLMQLFDICNIFLSKHMTWQEIAAKNFNLRKRN